MRLDLWWVLGAALALSTGGMEGSVRADGSPITDDDFLAEAITRSAGEGKAAELALSRATGEEIRQFARRTILQQRVFRPALNRLAWDNNVPVRFNQQTGQRSAETRLARSRGDAFDREFLSFLSEDLDKFIDLTQRCATGSGGPAERELASAVLPTLRKRLQEAQRLLKTMPKSDRPAPRAGTSGATGSD
jgi:predicted outer membrane protein